MTSPPSERKAPRLFRTIVVWDDPAPAPGPRQMAVDEALSEAAGERVILRHYRWQGRWASFGRSQSATAARTEAPGFSIVRRPTGGGIVRHDADWTFSVFVPSAHPAARLRPREFYRQLHEAVASLLPGEGARLAAADDCLAHKACFSGPALFDVMDAAGQKLCGGAQRRTRSGILHQGSLQQAEVPGDFVWQFAEAIARAVEPFEPPPTLQTRSAELEAAHYGNPAWTERVP